MDELLVKLQIYEGPLDLLLHLIHKNEVELDDIPVALITAQYLEYLDLMEALNVEVAADFLVMAATLIQIKSRFLLPRESTAEDESLAGDLQTALIDPLMAHLDRAVNFQDVALVLGRRRLLGRDVFGRGGQPLAEAETETAALSDGFIEASLFDLMEAFRRVSDQKPRDPALEFVVESKTIGRRLVEIQDFLKARPQGTFAEICARDMERGEVILSFLAVLELARVGFLRLYQDLRRGREIMVFLADPEAVIPVA
jgi:segregation and condensation protein A